MEADEAPLDEIAHAQPAAPPLVVGVANHESRKEEEEVDGQIAVVEALVDGAGGEGLEEVVPDHQQSGDAAQAVQQFVVGFRIGECRMGVSMVRSFSELCDTAKLRSGG